MIVRILRDHLNMRKINLAQAFSGIPDAWNPRIAADVNNCQVKLVKLAGRFHWHHHETEDELFLVVSGTLRMHSRTGAIDLHEGEMLMVPHGVEHCPEAITDECHVLLVEPSSTLNTGTVVNERTVRQLQHLDPAG